MASGLIGRSEASALTRHAAPPVHIVCGGCGHRISLHGLYLRETWCINWNGSRFCGCPSYISAADAELESEPEFGPDPDAAYDRWREGVA